MIAQFLKMNEALKSFRISLIVFSLYSTISAQEVDYDFEYITIEHGLSQNSVNCILKDSKGFMWFDRYDGYNFKIYRKHAFKANTLSNNRITAPS